MLYTSLHEAVAAPSDLTANAGVAGVVVVVLARFIARRTTAPGQANLAALAGLLIAAQLGGACAEIISDVSITAARRLAAREATVGRQVVAIIAGFKAHLLVAQVRPTDPVTAPSDSTGVCACIGRLGVAVVTLLLRVVDPIAAALDGAVVSAPVTQLLVAIIAALKAGRTGGEVCSRDAVAAPSHLAGVGAGVVIVPIFIVTGLFARPDDSIAAARYLATVRACVVVECVAVVAGFVAAEQAVSAAGGRTPRGALVVVVLVAIITDLKARFTLSQIGAGDAVAAARRRTCAGAAVVIAIVAVVALLLAGRPLADVLANGAVAAGRRLTRVGARVDVDGVAVVTTLDAVLDVPIAAARGAAVARARVRVVRVAIIAGLGPGDGRVSTEAFIDGLRGRTAQGDQEG